MKIEEVASRVVELLEQRKINYMVVGAFATIHYGLSRSTSDADFVVELRGERLSEIVAELGPGFVLDPQPIFEVFTSKTMRVVQLQDSPLKIDFFPVSSDPFDFECFARRQRVTFLGRPAFMPTAEDVVVQKLRWGRDHDLVDAKNVMAVQGDALDWAYIERWCQQHGTRATLDRLRSEIPPL